MEKRKKTSYTTNVERFDGDILVSVAANRNRFRHDARYSSAASLFLSAQYATTVNRRYIMTPLVDAIGANKYYDKT